VTSPVVASTIVACCQLAPELGNPAANRELAAAAVSDAARLGASVVVLPELMSSGYVLESQTEARAIAEPPDGPTITAWAQLAAELRPRVS
jgi:5-aminopentanamidase